MKSNQEIPKANVARGLPSVNETRKKSNWKAITLFILIALAVGGGASYWVYLKVKDAKQNMMKPKKPPEEKSAVKARVFGPAPAGADGTPGDATATTAAQQPGASAATPAGAPGMQARVGGAIPVPGAPAVPPPLGGAVPTMPAPPEAHVPAIALAGAPARPAPLNGRAAGGGDTGAVSGRAGATREQAQRPADDRSRFDTPFVVNGEIQPGGRSSSPMGDALQIGKEALAAQAQGGARMPSFSGGASGSGNEGGKGALSGMLTPTATPAVRAGMLGNLNLTVRKGTPAECVLQTKIVAMLPGLVKCRLTSPIYSANGKVILADRGSEFVGEQGGTMRQGQARLFVLWTQIDTPDGVTIPIDSPASDALGAAGVDGEVSNHWGERIGASLLLSVIDDAFAYQVAKAGSSNSGNGTSGGVAYQNTQQQGQRIAEKVLDSTINIPPTLYKNQGEKISIIIARNLDFSSVYSLEAK